MYELMQHILAYKYACKINHWSTDDYAAHLKFDRLTENTDDWIDKIAESYFMARDEKKIFKADLLNPKMIDKNLQRMCEGIIAHLEEIQDDNDDLDEGAKSLLGDIEADFLGKLALIKLS